MKCKDPSSIESNESNVTPSGLNMHVSAFVLVTILHLGRTKSRLSKIVLNSAILMLQRYTEPKYTYPAV
jgi:hypothetical protein